MRKFFCVLLLVASIAFVVVGLTSCDSDSKTGSHDTCPAVQPDCD